jgi:hypothetical protein
MKRIGVGEHGGWLEVCKGQENDGGGGLGLKIV